MLDAFFYHLIKEGIRPDHLISLAEYGRKALETYLEQNKNSDWPIGLRILADIRCNGLIEILDVVSKSTKSRPLKARVLELVGSAKKFQTRINPQGFRTGTFEEVWKTIRERGCKLDRERAYPRALRGLYDYTETPSEVEEKGLSYLRNELGEYQRAVDDLAVSLGCEGRGEAVGKALAKKKGLESGKIIAFISRVRELLVKMVDSRIVGINRKYRTRVIMTPEYLSGVIPSGAAYGLDYLGTTPKQVFLVTDDPKLNSPPWIPAELIGLLVHEEYGHCVNYSNSAAGYGAKPGFAEMLSSSLGEAVSEGLSFERELEFLDYLGRLSQQARLTREERSFIRLCERFGGFEALRQEYEFGTRAARITRFLRVVGDARINSGKQDLPDFIEWATKETGLSKSGVYFNVFPAHQAIGPGYATTYAIIGESIRQIQEAAVRAGKDFVKFNTYACSQGFTSRTVLESRLLEFANG